MDDELTKEGVSVSDNESELREQLRDALTRLKHKWQQRDHADYSRNNFGMMAYPSLYANYLRDKTNPRKYTKKRPIAEVLSDGS